MTVEIRDSEMFVGIATEVPCSFAGPGTVRER